MNYITATGTLEQLRAIPSIDGVEYVSRGIRALPDGTYEARAYVDESAIPLIQAQGVIVTVTQTQADIDKRLEQINEEQQGNNNVA
jgi:hypothetical protein